MLTSLCYDRRSLAKSVAQHDINAKFAYLLVVSMMASGAKKKRKKKETGVKRKPSLSDGNIRCLIESFDCQKYILLSKFNNVPVE